MWSYCLVVLGGLTSSLVLFSALDVETSWLVGGPAAAGLLAALYGVVRRLAIPDGPGGLGRHVIGTRCWTVGRDARG